MKIAYLTNCFTTQSHTFIRREIDALRKLDVQISLYGIRQDAQPAPDAPTIRDETQYLHPTRWQETVKNNLRYLLRSPWHYFKGVLQALCKQEFSVKRRLKMFYHFLISANFASRMEAEGISHIHAHFLNVSSSIAMYASHHSGIPYSITVHSAGTFKTPHMLGMQQKLAEAQFLIMISHYNIEYFTAIEACRHKSHVVRCGMNLEEFTVKEAQPIPISCRILAVGRFVQKKGFAYLIEAANLLKREGFQFTLSIIGDGPLMAELKQQVAGFELGQQVQFTGQQSTEYVREAMLESDIVVVPSVTSDSGEKEGLPVVIMEAMASGIPVVASNHSGIHEIVKHAATGFLTEEKDSMAIAQAITQLSLQTNREMIGNAYDLISSDFEITKVAERRLQLFRRYEQAEG